MFRIYKCTQLLGHRKIVIHRVYGKRWIAYCQHGKNGYGVAESDSFEKLLTYVTQRIR